jgi:hypothetical protein
MTSSAATRKNATICRNSRIGSPMRRAAKVDTAQPSIVRDLQKLGYEVYLIKKPCDVSVRHPMWRGGLNQWLEIKTPTRSGKMPKPDPRQTEQAEFLAKSNTPVVMSLDQALKALEGL